MAIAIFGGSFNPPANSHLNLALQILEKLGNIEKVVFVPVSTKYNKQNLADDMHRYNMLKIMCDKYDKLDVSDIELKSKTQLFTIQTLNKFKKKYANKEIYFIMGTDNLKDLKNWRSPEEILKNYKIIVLERNYDNIESIINTDKLLKKHKSSIIKLVDLKKIYMSSTIIREKIKNNESIENLVDNDVLEYIKKEQLYKFID